MALSVRLGGEPVAILGLSDKEPWALDYLDGYSGLGLSISLPAAIGRHYPEEKVMPWLAGLLPDSAAVRRTLSERLNLGSATDYELLAALGRDLPGAVSVVSMDAAVLLDENITPSWMPMTDAELAERIRHLADRPLFVDEDGELRLSLAGAHDKAGVMLANGRPALPIGGTPSTHILKVDIRSLPDSVKTEHFCLQAARAVGLATASSKIGVAEDQTYMLVARYDRAVAGGESRRWLRRVHQEDFCQALSIYPDRKYEKDGGPGWKDGFGLMEYSGSLADDKTELLRRAVFQYLIGNPDAHAKNYSLLHKDGEVRLAKLYDVNNAAAFRSFYKEQRHRLAMFVGGERNPDLLTPEHWRAFARDAGVGAAVVLQAIEEMANRLPVVLEGLRREMEGTLAYSPLLDLVIEDVTARCAAVARDLAPTVSVKAVDSSDVRSTPRRPRAGR